MPDELSSVMSAMSPWEVLAVVLAIAYLLLAAREHIACWACALLSTSIYIVLFFDVSLLMESALNVYYLLMAIYGWYLWRANDDEPSRPISTWSAKQHVVVISGVLLLSVLSGQLLDQFSSAAWPYLDSFTTWGAVVTTVMVAHKVLENWLYWLVIDAISIPLYVERGLVLTAGLFAVYLVIVVLGYINWRRIYRSTHHAQQRAQNLS